MVRAAQVSGRATGQRDNVWVGHDATMPPEPGAAVVLCDLAPDFFIHRVEAGGNVSATVAA
jgi:hypothetical protein